MSRRDFIRTTAAASTALAAGACQTTHHRAAWPIGCFNRPWMQKFGTETAPIDIPQPANWGLDVALQGIKEAGFERMGLLTPMKDEVFIAEEATDEYLTKLKACVAASGLPAEMGSIRIKPELEVDAAIANVRRQIDHAKFLNLKWLLTFGVDKKEHYEKYYKMMADAADYSEAAGIKLVMKPHGGASGASEEIQRCLTAVNRPNFKIWYDAGNIVYYDGKDPVEELKPIVQYVTGFCAKDCAAKHADVMIPFGTGKANFPGVFKVLKAAGFNGPIFVECAAGKSYPEVTAGARANRLFLENTLAAL